jgi:hypothetical protein
MTERSGRHPPMPDAARPSAALIRAAEAEDERIRRALDTLDRRREALRGELAQLDRESERLHERRRALALAVGEEPDTAPKSSSREINTLRGRALRRVAGNLLWRSEGDHEIHYREWFERVLAAGFAVGGRDPGASFLTNVRNSPAVVRGARPGYYRLDPERRDRRREEIAEVRAELEDLGATLLRAREDPGLRDRVEDLRTHRSHLDQKLRRLETDLIELDEIFAEADERPPRRNLRAA